MAKREEITGLGSVPQHDQGLALDADVRQLLTRVSTATLTTRLFAHGLRNRFLHGVRPLNPQAARFVGEAFTLRYIPSREDLDLAEGFGDPEHPQRKAIENVGEGQVLVIDCRENTRAGALGSILVARLIQRRTTAVVTDGAVRDSPVIAGMDFPVFSAGGSAPLSLEVHHAIDFQLPIGCAGVAVFPGDVIVGDQEGVVVIPRHLARKVAEEAVEEENLDKFLLSRIEEGAPLPGTYPPDETTLELYRQYREEKSE